jgi:hypothetical protein
VECKGNAVLTRVARPVRTMLSISDVIFSRAASMIGMYRETALMDRSGIEFEERKVLVGEVGEVGDCSVSSDSASRAPIHRVMVRQSEQVHRSEWANQVQLY